MLTYAVEHRGDGHISPAAYAVSIGISKRRAEHLCSMAAAFGLSTAEVALIDRTLPPRDPLVVLERRLRKLQRAPTG